MDQSVPFLDLSSTHRDLEGEILDALRDALRQAAFVGGHEVEAFEQEFAEYCGTRFAVGVGSGTDALRFALMASGVGPGDAVVTVSMSFVATVEAIVQAGADTEFVDVDEYTCTMSPESLATYLEGCRRDPESGRLLGQRSGRPIKAIVPVHLYGHVADMDALTELARRHDLLVVEDACQAHGAEHLSSSDVPEGWRRAGAIGNAAAFSFYPGKNLGACGEAGAVTTDDEEVADQVRMLRDHGQTRKYDHRILGYNGRLDAIQAGILRIKLRHLDAWNSERRAAAARYKELLSAAAPDLRTPFEAPWCRPVYHLYVIRAPYREALAQHLKAEGITTGLHYPRPIHRQVCCQEWKYEPGSLPVTEQLAREVLSLPMFPGLSAEQQERVVAEIQACAGSLGIESRTGQQSHRLSAEAGA